MTRNESAGTPRPLAEEQLSTLLDAVVALVAGESLDGVLRRVLAAAATLTDAQYVALGVIDPRTGARLQTFLHQGMEDDVVERIGALPVGHGLLGVLIDDPRPIRLSDVARHPRSSGFPRHHPVMTSFLGVPIRVRDRVFGNLYLTDKHGGGDFTVEDERRVIALAAAAGAAVDNARLQEQGRRREAWLAATLTISTSLVAGTSPEEALQLVADQARVAAGAELAWVMTAGSSGPVTDVVSGPWAGVVGARCRPELQSSADVVMSTGESQVVTEPAYDDQVVEVGGGAGGYGAWPRLDPVVMVPLAAPGGSAGVLCLGWTPGAGEALLEIEPGLPAGFAHQASLAIQVAAARADRQQLLIFEERDRIGRDLHDLVIQRLFATGLGLQRAARLARDDPDLSARLERALDDLDDTIGDIRRTIFSLGRPADAGDVQDEVEQLVARAAGTLKSRPRLRIVGPLRSAVRPPLAQDVLAVVGEALSNASRHARAAAVEVCITVDEAVEVRVRDDGVGIQGGAAAGGLGNLRRRASAHRGTFDVHSAPGAGTTVVWRVPLPVTSR